MAFFNSLYQTYTRKYSISLLNQSNFYLLNFLKQTLYPPLSSSFIWRNCYSYINEMFISRTDHICHRNPNRPTTFSSRRQNCVPTESFRVRLLTMFSAPQVQQVRLYSSERKGNENSVLEISINNPSPLQKKVDSTTYRKILRNVPQPIVLLTSAKFQTETNSWLKRGAACSSLLSVSLQPPILSFCLNRPSRMHDLLEQSHQFAINILGRHQAELVNLFSSPAQDGVDQFSGIPHQLSEEGLPVLSDTPVLLCQTHCVHNVGDHSVWYGVVTSTLHESKLIEPVLHYLGSYHDMGEKIPTLPRCVFTQNPIMFCLQITWKCSKRQSLEDSLHCMKEMFQKQFKSKERDWHETIARFYLKNTLMAFEAEQNSEQTFEEFLQKNKTLLNLNDQILQYYTIKLLSSPEAKEKYVLPDRKQFNS